MTPEERAFKLLKECWDTGAVFDRENWALATIEVAIHEAIREERQACADLAERLPNAKGNWIAQAIRQRELPHKQEGQR